MNLITTFACYQDHAETGFPRVDYSYIREDGTATEFQTLTLRPTRIGEGYIPPPPFPFPLPITEEEKRDIDKMAVLGSGKRAQKSPNHPFRSSSQ